MAYSTNWFFIHCFGVNWMNLSFGITCIVHLSCQIIRESLDHGLNSKICWIWFELFNGVREPSKAHKSFKTKVTVCTPQPPSVANARQFSIFFLRLAQALGIILLAVLEMIIKNLREKKTVLKHKPRMYFSRVDFLFSFEHFRRGSTWNCFQIPFLCLPQNW